MGMTEGEDMDAINTRLQEIVRARFEQISRVPTQAAPAQIRKLNRYGETHPSLRAIAEDPQEALKGESSDALLVHLMLLEGCDIANGEVRSNFDGSIIAKEGPCRSIVKEKS